MTPKKFAEANVKLLPPPDMPECGILHAARTGTQHISKWKLSAFERLHVLIFGTVWLWVWMPHTQPPVSLEVRSPFRMKGDNIMVALGGRVPWIKRWLVRRQINQAVRETLSKMGDQ